MKSFSVWVSLAVSSSLFPLSLHFFFNLFIQAHGRALVHAHVSVAEQTARVALDVFRVEGMEFFRSHFQVRSHFRTRGHLRDVETVLTTWGGVYVSEREKTN